jgi:hypothetical protein
MVNTRRATRLCEAGLLFWAAGCGDTKPASTGATGATDGGAGGADAGPTVCATDGSDAIARGTYWIDWPLYGLQDAAPSIHILTADCRYCEIAVATHTADSHGDRWSSAWNADKSAILVTLYNVDPSQSSMFQYQVDSMGSTLREYPPMSSPPAAQRLNDPSYTCDGMPGPSQ